MRLNSKTLSSKLDELETKIQAKDQVDFIVLVGVKPERGGAAIIGFNHKRDYLLGRDGKTLEDLERQIKRDNPQDKFFIVGAIQEDDV